MSEWRKKPLIEVAANSPTAIVDGPFGSNLKTSDYVENGIPVLQGNNITKDRFVWKNINFISQSKASQLIRSAVRVGDLLVVKIGSVGYSAILSTLNDHDYGIIPANLLKATFNEKIVDTKFIYYSLTSENGKRLLQDLSGHTAQPALSLTKFKSIKLLFPPLCEQRKISEILSSIDDCIDQTKSIIKKYQQIKAGMMHDLFTRGVDAHGCLRPPREEDPELYQDITQGFFPKNWKRVTLGEVSEIVSGVTLGNKSEDHEQHSGALS